LGERLSKHPSHVCQILCSRNQNLINLIKELHVSLQGLLACLLADVIIAAHRTLSPSSYTQAEERVHYNAISLSAAAADERASSTWMNFPCAATFN